MTTEQTVATNAAAIRNLAARLEKWGLSDPEQRAEFIAVNLLLDGYKRVEPVPAPAGPSSTEEGRAKAREIFEETLRARGAR